MAEIEAHTRRITARYGLSAGPADGEDEQPPTL